MLRACFDLPRGSFNLEVGPNNMAQEKVRQPLKYWMQIINMHIDSYYDLPRGSSNSGVGSNIKAQEKVHTLRKTC